MAKPYLVITWLVFSLKLHFSHKIWLFFAIIILCYTCTLDHIHVRKFSITVSDTTETGQVYIIFLEILFFSGRFLGFY